MDTAIAFWSILKKDMTTYYFKPPNISWGILFPLSWALMQLIRSKGSVGIEELLPGLMAMSVLFGTTSMLAVTVTFEKRSRSFDRLLVAPIGIGTLVFAKIFGAVLFGFINAFIPVAFAAFFVPLNGIDKGTAVAGVFLIAVASALLGLFIAVSAKEVFEAQTLSNFFRIAIKAPPYDMPVIPKPYSSLPERLSQCRNKNYKIQFFRMLRRHKKKRVTVKRNRIKTLSKG
jgi:ABC-2 type transport system permease protein